MALKIPPGRHHWTIMSIYMQAKKQCFQESWYTCLKARDAEGFSDSSQHNHPSLVVCRLFCLSIVRWGLPTILAFHNISIVEFAAGLPCNRRTPDCWSFPQKWMCSTQELPELFPVVLGLVLGPCWWLKHQGRTYKGAETSSVSF